MPPPCPPPGIVSQVFGRVGRGRGWTIIALSLSSGTKRSSREGRIISTGFSTGDKIPSTAMGRKILAMICSYAALSIVVLATMAAAFMILGVDRAHEPGSYSPSLVWCVLSLVIGAVASFVGGWLCSRITRDGSTFYWVIGLILVFGVLEVIRISNLPRVVEPRGPDVDLSTAVQKSITPLWVLIASPLIGAVGAFIGGRVGAPKGSKEHTASPSPR